MIGGCLFGRIDFIARLRPDLVLMGVRVPYTAGDEVFTGHASHPKLNPRAGRGRSAEQRSQPEPIAAPSNAPAATSLR